MKLYDTIVTIGKSVESGTFYKITATTDFYGNYTDSFTIILQWK